MTKYMLDTNICIYILKQRPEKVIQKFQILRPKAIYLSSVVCFELEYGALQRGSQKSRMALDSFLDPLTVVGFDQKAATVAATIRYDLQKKGTPIGSFDLLIAAHAISEDAVLVTNNYSEFSRVTDLEIENWI